MAANFDLFRMHLHRQPSTNTKLDLQSPIVDRDKKLVQCELKQTPSLS